MSEGKNILVTGANGFIGRWLCKELSGKNKVTGLVRDKNKTGFLNKYGIDLIEGDISLVSELGDFDFLIHLAAMSNVSECNTNPLKAMEVNGKGTYNVLELCKKSKGVITVSSTKVYGNGGGEESILRPSSVYGLTKMYSEYLTREFSRKYNIPFIIPRIANVYGPFDNNSERIIPSTIEHILAGKKPFIFGDGSMERVFVYIKDVVDFLLLSLELLERGESGVFNVGSKKIHSIGFVIEKIVKMMKWENGVEYKRGTQAKSDKALSIEKAQKMGWVPKYSLEKGLEETIQRYKEGST